jgi:hypothetical protein
LSISFGSFVQGRRGKYGRCTAVLHRVFTPELVAVEALPASAIQCANFKSPLLIFGAERNGNSSRR